MTEDYLTLEVFRTLLQYDNHVNTAIENTKMVLAELFPVVSVEETDILADISF